MKKRFKIVIFVLYNTLLPFIIAGVTSHGLSCGVCKYKAHKSCVGNVLAGCKWSTRDTVDQRCISLENVSIEYKAPIIIRPLRFAHSHMGNAHFA